MRGDVKEVEAARLAEAFKTCVKEFPETTSWDILKVIDEEGKEV